MQGKNISGRDHPYNNSRERCSIGEYCYLLYLAIFCGLKALGFYEGQPVFTAGLLIAFVCLLIKLASTRHTRLEYAVILLLLGMGLLVYHNTGEKSLLVNLGVLVGAKGVSEKRAFRTYFAVWGICYTGLTFATLTGLHGDVLYMHNKHGIGYVICHSMGYAHSNVLHINYLCISAMILYLVKDSFSRRAKYALTAILAALNLYVFLYSMSFTGFLAGILFYIVYLWFALRGQITLPGRWFCSALIPALALFFIAGPVLIQGRLFDLINKALNTRFNLTRWFLTEQPITAFGTRFEIPNYRYTLDCSYAYLFMQLGVVPFVVILTLYVLTIRRLARDGKLTELAITIGLCIAGGTEPFLFNMSFKNVTLLFVGEYLFELIRAVEMRVFTSQYKGLERGGSQSYVRVDECGSAANCEEEGANACSTDKCSMLSTSESEHAICARAESVQVPESLRICDRLCHGLAQIYRCWKENALRYIILFLLCGAVGTGTAAMLRSPVHTVYINSSVNEEEERTPYYITKEEKAELTAGDVLIYGYVDENEKMYPYEGSTATFEYVRILISSGFWCGAVCCMAAGAVQRMRRQQR